MPKFDFVRARLGTDESSKLADNEGDLFRFDAHALTASSGTGVAEAALAPVPPQNAVNPYPAVIDLGALGSLGIRIAGQSLTASGLGVAAAGDVNNDGIADFIIGNGGLRGAISTQPIGEEYVIFGKIGLSGFTLAPGISAADGFRIAGEDYAENSGTTFDYAGIGDINNDGFDDVMFGALAFNTNGLGNNNVGAAYVVFGKGSGIGTVQLGSSMGSAGFRITGTETGGEVGTVSAAGDFNHDGIADFAVGGRFVDGNGAESGAVQIFFGKASGWANLNFGSNATPSITLVGAAGDFLGGKVSSAGDVNGDGFDDLIVNATHGATTPAYNSTPGYSYVVFGSGAASGTINLSTMGVSAGFKITGDTAHPVLGIDVAGIGDFNGDGFDDVAVSSGEYYGSQGRTYIVFGHAAGAAVTVSDSMASTVGFEIIGSGLEDAGWSISRAGDLNGDGLADLIIGAPNRLGGTASSAYVIFGKASGIGTINLSSLAAGDGFKIVGTSGSTTGFSVAGVGDVNGDHVDDLLVGAPGEGTSGASYVIFGISTNTPPVIDLNGAGAGTGATLAYTENAVSAIAPAATVTDAESLNFDTGTLTVNFTANGSVDDRLSIISTGNGAGQIGVAGNAVSYGGVQIGTFTGGTNGSTPLDVMLDPDATPAAVQTLARAIAFSNVSDIPSTAARTVQFVVTDGDGGTSSAVTATVNVTAVNDAPVFAALNGTPTFTEGGAAVVLDNNATVTDAELTGGNYNGATLTLARSGAAVGQDLFGTTGTLAFTGSGSGNVNVSATTVGTYTQSGGTLAISFNASATQALVNSTLQQLTYKNTSDNPPTSAVIAYVFSDGNAGSQGTGGALVATGSATVAITAVNDAPTAILSNHNLGPATEQVAFNLKNSGLSVGDIDGNGGSETVTLAVGQGVLNVTAGTSGAGVSGSGTGTVTITGTITQINALLNTDGTSTISYLNSSDTPPASTSISLTIHDNGATGGGDLSANDSGTISITAVDDVSVAVSDAATLAENGARNIDVLANDSDVAGPAKAVAQIDGNAIAVGGTIVLASGATVKLEGDGTLTYDPNHAFDATPVAGSGASNTPAHDSFQYTMTGGGSATVTMTVTGIDTDDRLLGTGGNDTLIGGIGNDTYVVGNSGDSIVEFVGGGTDTVETALAIYILNAANLENLIGTTNAGQVLAGNGLDNRITGGTGNDTMQGGLGNDIYVVLNSGDTIVEQAGGGADTVETNLGSYILNAANVENLTGTSNAGQSLGGNGLDNVITGGTGNDTMQGGLGNDIYVVLNSGDTIVEQAGGGTDTVQTGLASYILQAANVENLTGTSNAGQALEGNSLDNRITGGTGNDVLHGGLGDDTYVVRNAGDTIVEVAGEGTDTIETALNYYVMGAANVENLTFTGAGDFYGSGNDGDNLITGGNGNDILRGGLGADTLIGGSGSNSYLFDTALGGGNLDTITGFASGSDHILLDNNIFSALSEGGLAPSAFVVGTQAGDADDRIIYDATTGNLYYDADGNGAGAAVQFATLSGHPALVANDFAVI